MMTCQENFLKKARWVKKPALDGGGPDWIRTGDLLRVKQMSYCASKLL